LTVLIIVLLLAMKQYDRQYQIVRSIDQQGRDQLKELVAIRSALEHGVAINSPTTQQQAAIEGADPFGSLRQLRNQGKYDQGDWLVLNSPALVEKLTPIISTSLYAQWVANRIVETLAYPDPDTLKPLPLLATGWQISPDGLNITFQLRHGVTFS